MTDPNQPAHEAPPESASAADPGARLVPGPGPGRGPEPALDAPVEVLAAADTVDDEPLPLPHPARVVSAAAPVAAAIPMVAGRRQFARTTPVVVDRGRASFGFPSLGDRRQLGQIGLVVLMVAALGAILLARVGAPGTSGVAAGSPTPRGSAAASPRPTPRPSTSASVSPAPSTSPVARSPAPSPSAKPRTYTVKSGDSLSGIAARFHTTVKILEQLNNLKVPFVIHPGQVLKLP
jgi:hypothetical protein